MAPATRNQGRQITLSFSTKSSPSKEPLHQVLQKHLLKNDASQQMTTSQRAVLKFSIDGKQASAVSETPPIQRSGNHHYTSVQERSRIQQQAIINGLIAFSVVILACQNLKASVDKKQIQEQLQQQQDECNTARHALQQLLQRPHMDDIAAQIVQELESLSERPSNGGGWFRNGKSTEGTPERNKVQLIADQLERHLNSMVGDAALEERERDLKKVQALNTPASTEQVSLTTEVELTDAPVVIEDVLALLQEESSNETGPKVVKKRLFSM